MTPPSLAAADFLADALVARVLSELSTAGEEARVIGGAVRNALLGEPVDEVDIATTAVPAEVTRRMGAAGLKVVPTGIEHGTVTVVGLGRAVEVTTLREDVETDGRRAVVRFGRDWTADARRRDFTINALSVGLDGALRDPIGGYPDIVARRIRFIGAAERRIAEDRLRVLRFFRFHARYGSGPPDGEGLSASIRARHDLRSLSAERIGQEMKKLVVAPGAAATVAVMQESGILPLVLSGVADLAGFARLAAFEAETGRAPEPAVRMTALAVRTAEDALRLTERLRLSNAERDRMLAALAALPVLAMSSGERGDRAALYRLGARAYGDGVLLALARGLVPPAAAPARLTLPDRWTPPRFPLSGRDVTAAGIRGPAVGVLLRTLEDGWIAEDFEPDAAALRRRLQAVQQAQ
ncbi:CCA tRNA nucleotidyltransferase [Prosthecomicrobium pneumaticum]|uniref:tRNA nucleotidyltransferase/poly(A) polymerase n=1 Tax=Prosthecomicrobium pneumaticum TaxID=81895 RepID=A0A7W9L1K1_9HYPH|nr:CCA tRNA nucleotidyltransferase [Prosthecomicrobium pneumaticum]MBB5752814.1 tRNA nucleotidyltransferase/poly(A) polymerase [Prosthecomicrobium pneumaticum]